jgi:ABC-2 type transport system permease protein
MMRAVVALWHREIVRFLRDRSRLTGSLLQPVVFWLLFSGALHGSFKPGAAGVTHRVAVGYGGDGI